MARPRQREQDLPISPAAPPAAPERPSPAVPEMFPAALDFELASVPWRIERFESLVAEFQLSGRGEPWEKLARRFVLFARDYDRQWICVRRLFGIAPVVPPPDLHPAELRTWTRDELESDGFQVQAELDMLRGLWNSMLQSSALNPQNPPVVPGPESEKPSKPSTKPPELELDDKLLAEFGFPERLFRIMVWDSMERKDVRREAAEEQAEREWFKQRVKEWAKMLRNSVGGPLARGALMNELYLRRLESQIATAASKEVDRLLERQHDLNEEYQEQIEKLQAMFPDMAVAKGVSFHGALSDAIWGKLLYYAHGDTRLINKVFTAMELEFGLRESRQVPARHRFSLDLAIAEAIHNLYEPDFRSQFKPGYLKQYEAGCRAGAKVMRDGLELPVVDLEKGVEPGDGDQFEDFHDAECPECGERISSAALECPHCKMKNPNDKISETII